MRLFPGADIRISFGSGAVLACALFLTSSFPALAEDAPADTPATNAASAVAGAADPVIKQAIDRSSYLQGMQAALGLAGAGSDKDKKEAEEKEKQPDLGSPTDPNSARYKSEHLAKQAIRQREQQVSLAPKDDVSLQLPPPEVETLQRVNESLGGMSGGLSDDPVNKELSLELRKDAQREAALSYGARGGLAKHNYEIMERIRGFDPVLDRVFNFRSLLITAPSGMLIEPPIVSESTNALVITEGGNEAAVANQIFDINKKAKIVSAPRDWRQYLVQSWSEVPPPPRILWPKDAAEQASWNGWVAAGWKAGIEQAEQIFESNTNRLSADYSGMVRYKMLLAQGMISEPYALHEDRGVTGDKNQMRVGDRALRITGPSQFLTGADLWKPADR